MDVIHVKNISTPTLLHRKHKSGWRKSRECETSEQSEAAETEKGAEQSEAEEQRKAAEQGKERNRERQRRLHMDKEEQRNH